MEHKKADLYFLQNTTFQGRDILDNAKYIIEPTSTDTILRIMINPSSSYEALALIAQLISMFLFEC